MPAVLPGKNTNDKENGKNSIAGGGVPVWAHYSTYYFPSSNPLHLPSFEKKSHAEMLKLKRLHFAKDKDTNEKKDTVKKRKSSTQNLLKGQRSSQRLSNQDVDQLETFLNKSKFFNDEKANESNTTDSPSSLGYCAFQDGTDSQKISPSSSVYLTTSVLR